MRNKDDFCVENFEVLEPFAEHLLEMDRRGHHPWLKRRNVEYFLMGLRQQVPRVWNKHFKEYLKDLKVKKDPEYVEYQRLKAKFEK